MIKLRWQKNSHYWITYVKGYYFYMRDGSPVIYGSNNQAYSNIKLALEDYGIIEKQTLSDTSPDVSLGI